MTFCFLIPDLSSVRVVGEKGKGPSYLNLLLFLLEITVIFIQLEILIKIKSTENEAL